MNKWHRHTWGGPVAGTTFMGFFSWEVRTRVIQKCNHCGKIRARSIPGAWQNKDSL